MDIQIHELIKAFDPGRPILKGLNLTISDGEFVSITGRSGSGKSTFLYCVSALDTVSSGQVRIGGRDIHALDEREIHRFRNEEMGFVFQFHYLLPELTALENVLMPARKQNKQDSMRDDALELMEKFEVLHAKDRKPSQMSGGEQQRVAIARALIMKPSLLFADEPTGNLDSVNGQTVLSIIEQINHEMGVTVLMVTHEPDYAAMAHRELEFSDGTIIKDRIHRKRK
ncbi:MAG: ABC transporter ATP-binding protein [Leptospiraceae bacterium]|nr:ABC transporter ATP-binding protein [Leptospiraceae bacterium]